MSDAGDPASAIQLRHLRYVLAVMDERHFGRAAHRLNIAQPPLSQAIAKVEGALGVDLFVRTSHGAVPTDAGRVFATHAREALDAVAAGVTGARSISGRTALRIGAVPYLDFDRIDRFVSALQRRASDLEVELSHALTGDLLARVRAGDLDVGIFPSAGGHPDLAAEALFPGEPLVAYVPANHRLAACSAITPADVRGEDLIIFRRSILPELYDWWLAAIEASGYRFRGVRTVGGSAPQDLIAAVAHGLGVGVASAEFREMSAMSTRVVTRALDPAIAGPVKVAAWRAKQPREMAKILGAARDVARAVYADEQAAVTLPAPG